MNIRMIGFDLDGTLLTTDKILTERTKKALEAAADQGVILVPATGRPLCGLPKELLELPFIKYAVTANGARILETKTEQVLSEMLISVEKAREILDIFSDYDTLRDVYYDGIGYSEKEKLVHIQDYVMTKAMGEYILNTRVPVESVEEKFETENRGTDKVQALFRYQTDKEEAWKRIRKVTGVEATGALENNIEVNAEGVHKGMQGWVCLDDLSNGALLINFPQCGENEDIATISIKETDMKLIPRMDAKVNERIREAWDEGNPPSES